MFCCSLAARSLWFKQFKQMGAWAVHKKERSPVFELLSKPVSDLREEMAGDSFFQGEILFLMKSPYIGLTNLRRDVLLAQQDHVCMWQMK